MKRKTSNHLHEYHKETWNEESGELTAVRREIVKKVQKEKFGIVYLETVLQLLGIKSATHLRVMISLWSISEMDTNRIILVKSIKQELAEKTGYKIGTIQNSISFLSRKKILIHKDTSVYILNPKYFFRGNEMARAKTVELLLKIEGL